MIDRQVVVNADDLGLVASVNRGIVESIERGIVTSASLMVNMPGTDDAIARLHELARRAPPPCVGLHFNVVAGEPLTSCRTIVGPRSFLPLPQLAFRALTQRVVQDDVELELEAQLHRARDLLAPLGLQVTHIDSHRHAHCLPGLFDVVLRVARRHRISHVRHPHESTSTMLRRPRAIVASHLLRAILTRRRPMDDVRFTGVALMGSRTFDRDVVSLFAALPAGTTELMVHPGYDSPELAAMDRYRSARERELRALTSRVLRERLEALGVRLARFGATAPPA